MICVYCFPGKTCVETSSVRAERSAIDDISVVSRVLKGSLTSTIVPWRYRVRYEQVEQLNVKHRRC